MSTISDSSNDIKSNSDAGSPKTSELNVDVNEERLRGDGQEEKKVDDDEDRRNPQYIPKRGNFYEHDNRTLEQCETEVNDDDEPKKKESGGFIKEKKDGATVDKDASDRWTHDLYIDAEQGQKSRDEIIKTYGYDIRNEDAPPRARRRRRYGRGPNKYTRNWEDEDAYNNRAKPVQPRAKKQTTTVTDEDFPPLQQHADDDATRVRKPREPDVRKTDREHGSEEKERRPRRKSNRVDQWDDHMANAAEKVRNAKKNSVKKSADLSRNSRGNTFTHASMDGQMYAQGSGPGAAIITQSYNNSNRNKPTDSAYESNQRILNAYNSGIYDNRAAYDSCKSNGAGVVMPAAPLVMSGGAKNIDPIADISGDMTNLQIDAYGNVAGANYPRPGRVQHVTNTTTQMIGQEQRSGPKRYSSLRQRPDAAANFVANPGHVGYFLPGEYMPTVEANEHVRGVNAPANSAVILSDMPTIVSAASQSNVAAQSYVVNSVQQMQMQQQQQMAVVHQQQYAPGAQYAGQTSVYSLPPPNVAAATNAPSAPNNAAIYPTANQVVGYPSASGGSASTQTNAAPAQGYGATPPQGYPAYAATFTNPPVPAVPSTELYQSQGGITYYSPHNQPIAQRAPPMKRPKAAIPILAPSDYAHDKALEDAYNEMRRVSVDAEEYMFANPYECGDAGVIAVNSGEMTAPSHMIESQDTSSYSRGRGRKLTREHVDDGGKSARVGGSGRIVSSIDGNVSYVDKRRNSDGNE